MNSLISVITPTYNCEKYIVETINSVIAQTYQNWEMIIVDDCSFDNTIKLVEKMVLEDSRIKLFKQEENLGAAQARNRALMEAKGKYIAYLDADDIWNKDKLEKQLSYMESNNYSFSCTSYEVIDDDGNALDKYVYMKSEMDYKGFLTNNLLQTVGIMANIEIIDKKYFVMPVVRRGQDAATWLQVLKAGYKCYGMKDVLAKYRRASNSLSSNKFKAIKRTWYLYRKIEKLPFIYSCYCFVRYAFFAVWKRIYIPNK